MAWNFDFPNPTSVRHFIHSFSLRENRTGELMTDRLNFVFLEIDRFDKPQEACISFEERFLYMMKNLPIADVPVLWEEDPYFQTMLEEAEFARMSRAEQERYKKRLKMGDYKNQIDYAVQRGHAAGLAEGQAEEARAVARRMLAEGLSPEIVSKCTELSAKQVRALPNKSENFGVVGRPECDPLPVIPLGILVGFRQETDIIADLF